MAAEKDDAPPRISVQGSGSPGLNPQGEALMVDTVLFASDWADPGATASDVNELGATVNLTSRVQAFGAAAVDTTFATDPRSAFGYAIRYEVSDAAGVRSAPCVHTAMPSRLCVPLWLCVPADGQNMHRVTKARSVPSGAASQT